MQLRIIHGKLKPGTWAAYEEAYREVMAKAGPVQGLRARWLTRDIADPDAGFSISLWEDEASLRAYESGDLLRKTILPRLNAFFSNSFTTTHCEMRVLEQFDLS